MSKVSVTTQRARWSVSGTRRRDRASSPGHFVVLSELVDLFGAIGQLPHDLMDVAVLRHLCGLSLEETADVLGLSAAMGHAVDHHARATLDTLLTEQAPRE
jgi:DNA-directed RNA polymerase specialized sigma24 family protein